MEFNKGLEDQIDNLTIGNTASSTATDSTNNINNNLSPIDCKLIDELNNESKLISNQINELMNELKSSMSQFSSITLQSMECYHEAQVSLNENLLKALESNLNLIGKSEALDNQFNQLDVIKTKIKSIRSNLDQLEYLLK